MGIKGDGIMIKLKLFMEDEEKRKVLVLIISAVSLFISFFDLVQSSIDFAWISIMLCGLPIIKDAIIGLIKEFDIKADVLVSIALIASVIIGEVFVAGEVALIMTLGALLEEHTVAKAKAGIEKLVHLTPTTARVMRNNKEEIISAKDVLVNDIIKVRPGETIPVDGIVIEGATSIDQSIMTGESMPVDKGIWDEVFSGTVNQFGAFTMKATKVGEDSSLQKMIKLVQSADSGKAKIVGIADKWATWIVVIALISAILTWIITGEVIRSVTILVVFCPCSLVLATPTAIMAGIGNATKYGILIREGDALERLSRIKKITFDKTGTLTYGKPKITNIYSFEENLSNDELLKLAASVEKLSEHPIGKSIVDCFKNKSDSKLYEATNFKMEIGKGVCATVNNQKVFAGNKKLLNYNKLDLSNKEESLVSKFEEKGSIIIFIANEDAIKGFIVLEDVLRDSARNMIEKIKRLEAECILITGDNNQTANNIASMSGIKTVYSECLPSDKLSIIDNLQKDNYKVCMVGDGINDDPALKKSFVGIAMGGIGSDIAIEAADIALASDDIKCIPHLLALSKKTMKTININLILSMLLNFVAILLAMTGVLNQIVGALVHNIGSVLVIIHSALLLKWCS